MVWDTKTPLNKGVSEHWCLNFKARALASAGLGILFVFCAPGQLTKANYVSGVAQYEPSNSVVDVKELAGLETTTTAVEKSAEKPVENPGILRSTSEVLVVEKTPKVEKPVQLASLDLEIPEITKPKVFIPPVLKEPEVRRPVTKATPKLKKKLFGSVELKFDDERKIRAWSSVYDRLLRETDVMKACLAGGCSDPILAQWTNELRSMQSLPKFQKISAVNALVNRHRYTDDKRNYGRSDYWASPREFLLNGGDCEDYAILKFASLLALGVSDQDMRLVVGRLANGTPHAFLAANVGTQEYILDNRQTQVYLTANRTDYVPKYSMNFTYRWSHVVPRSKST